jgi:uncharacterized protein YbaR (Trm112 family)
MDILACPICKSFPLELQVFDAAKGEQKHRDKVGCELYCVYRGGPTSKYDKAELVRDCEICFSYDLKEALLTCKKCGRWYPVMDSIPHMLPDDLRKEAEDKQFLVKHSEKVPEKVKKEGLPFHL